MTWAAFLVACNSSVWAATNELDSVIVEASRIDDVSESLPASVSVFDAEDIARSGARDLPEFLSKRANLQVRTLNANPMQAQVAMRGFGENSFGRVKIIVDGEELNSVDMEAPNLARIPLGNVGRIEILPGASPVLHGDGAVAGVINVLTDSEDAPDRTRLAVHGGSQGTFGANVSTRGRLEEERLQYFAAYGYDRSDGYRDCSGYDLHSLSAGLRQGFENGSRVGLKVNYFNALYHMPGALSFDEWKVDPRQARYCRDWCRLWNYGLAVDVKAKLAEDQWLYVDGSFSVKHRTSNWGDYGYANEYDLYGYQFSPRYVNECALFELESKFTAGFDLRYDWYEVADRSGANNSHYDFDRLRSACFLAEEIFLCDELSLVAGARVEYADSRWHNFAGLRESTGFELTGDYELGLVYRPVEDLKTFAKGARFHRSPFCDELTYTENGAFLRPETGTTLDLGFEYDLTDEVRFDADGYWTIMDDEIFYNPYASASPWGWNGYNCNSPGQTDRLGFDTGLAWRREKVAEASVRYSFVNSRFRDGQYAGERIPLVPESRVRAQVGVWIHPDVEVKGGFRYVTSQVLAGDFNNEHDRLSGYSVFDIGIDYAPAWAEKWKASFVMDNLFDRQYCDFAGWSDYSGAYYYPACGRSFMFTVSYEF